MNRNLHVIESIVKELELPESAYLKAKSRYENLGEWLGDPSLAQSAKYRPNVFSQGSFRLGTAIKPLLDEHYDLDISCSMTSTLNHNNITQNELKTILYEDLEKYRSSKRMKTPIESKRRCLRLEYLDELNFHMDIVPSIPPNIQTPTRIRKLLLDSAATPELAESVANHALYITDCERLPQFYQLTEDWLLSNPEGYALWFDEQSKKARKHFMRSVLSEDGVMSKVEDLPSFNWNSPLQRAVKILKRHRDVMFEGNEDSKPISIILTTLSALAYEGEDNLAITVKNILGKIEGLVSTETPRIQNPVNDKEDFADKWATEEGIELGLEDNFWLWLDQAKRDFDFLESTDNSTSLNGAIKSAYNVNVRDSELASQIRTNKLLSKAALIGAGAMTSSSGTIAKTGVIANKEHRFYGDKPIDTAQK